MIIYLTELRMAKLILNPLMPGGNKKVTQENTDQK